MPKFSKRSKEALETCHPLLQQILNEAIKYYDFSILEGHREKIRQDILYNQGKSTVKYPHSKHNLSPSFAVDLAPYPVNWKDISSFHYLAGVILTVAKMLNIELIWGGHWLQFKDYDHFELKKGENK